MNLDDEQREIVERVDSLLANTQGYGWGHFQGDVVPRVLAHYINMHLPNNRKVVGPNVYIEGVPTEFDLMVVDAESNPLPLTSAYPGEHIRCVIEVKRRGTFGKIDEFKKKVERTKANFDKALFMWDWDKDRLHRIKERRVNCKAAYITMSETVNPKREGSNNYGKITRELLTPYPAFILQDSRSNELQHGEWQRFIEWITSEEYPAS